LPVRSRDFGFPNQLSVEFVHFPKHLCGVSQCFDASIVQLRLRAKQRGNVFNEIKALRISARTA
jgi:hypothetical protein